MTPFQLAWLFLKGEWETDTEKRRLQQQQQNQVYGSIPSMKQGAGMSFYLGITPVGREWADFMSQPNNYHPNENDYLSQMIKQMNHHAIDNMEEDPAYFSGELPYNHSDYPNPLPPEQLTELQNEYKQVVPAEHHMPPLEEILKLKKQRRLELLRNQQRGNREYEKGPVNIFNMKKDVD
tara:strand:+ start:6 stop:542 length:537 start_codon:yes stop_codon:yes gene_type:complete